MMVDMASSSPSAAGSRRDRLLRSALLTVVALQVLVPTVAILGEPPTRFGFQMFSALGQVDIEMWDEAGNELGPVPDGLIAGRLRPDLPWASGLPEYLCAHVDAAATVTVSDSSNSATATC